MVSEPAISDGPRPLLVARGIRKRFAGVRASTGSTWKSDPARSMRWWGRMGPARAP